MFKLFITYTILIMVLLVSGCSDRQRLNPLDPLNPNRQENNFGFNALAWNDRVILEWDALDFDDLEGIQIVRSSSDSQNEVVMPADDIFPPSTTTYVDTGAVNGITYSYSLKFTIKNSNEKPVSLPDSATPGPTYGWMELFDYGEIVMMTPDFRDEITKLEHSFMNIQDMQVDPDGSILWILDKATSGIYRYTLNGELIGNQASISTANAFQINKSNHTVMVATQDSRGTLYRFSTGSGEMLSSYVSNLQVTSIAVNHDDIYAWAGSSQPTIARINIASNNVTHFSHSEFNRPEGIVTGNYGDNVWILDVGANKVFLFNDDQVVATTSSFLNPTSLTANSDGSICWVADYGTENVYEIDQNGNFTTVIPNLGKPWALTYNDLDNTVYVSSESGLITKLAPGGTIIWQARYPEKTGIISLFQPYQ